MSQISVIAWLLGIVGISFVSYISWVGKLSSDVIVALVTCVCFLAMVIFMWVVGYIESRPSPLNILYDKSAYNGYGLYGNPLVHMYVLRAKIENGSNRTIEAIGATIESADLGVNIPAALLFTESRKKECTLHPHSFAIVDIMGLDLGNKEQVQASIVIRAHGQDTKASSRTMVFDSSNPHKLTG